MTQKPYPTNNNMIVAKAFLQGLEAKDVALSIQSVEEQFRTMSRLIDCTIEPNSNEFIKISNELQVASTFVNVCWRSLIKAGFVPGQKVSRPVKPLPTCKVKPKDIKTCSRLAYLKAGV